MLPQPKEHEKALVLSTRHVALSVEGIINSTNPKRLVNVTVRLRIYTPKTPQPRATDYRQCLVRDNYFKAQFLLDIRKVRRRRCFFVFGAGRRALACDCLSTCCARVRALISSFARLGVFTFLRAQSMFSECRARHRSHIYGRRNEANVGSVDNKPTQRHDDRNRQLKASFCLRSITLISLSACILIGESCCIKPYKQASAQTKHMSEGRFMNINFHPRKKNMQREGLRRVQTAAKIGRLLS